MANSGEIPLEAQVMIVGILRIPSHIDRGYSMGILRQLLGEQDQDRTSKGPP